MTQFSQQVDRLLYIVVDASNPEQAKQIVQNNIRLALDSRFFSCLFQSHKEVAKAQPNRALFFFTLVLQEVYSILSSMEPEKVGRGGVCTVLIIANRQQLPDNIKHFRSILDDTFFDGFEAMVHDFGINQPHHIGDEDRLRPDIVKGILVGVELEELRDKIGMTNSRWEAIELVVTAARTNQRWFWQGLDLMISGLTRFDLDESQRKFMKILPNMLKEVWQDLHTRQSEEAIIEKFLQVGEITQLIELQYLLSSAEGFGYIDTRTEFLKRFAFATNHREAWQIVTEEPGLLSEEAETMAYKLAIEHWQQEEYFAKRMQRAGDMLHQWRSKLKQNTVAMLAEQVIRGGLKNIETARRELGQPETVQTMDIPRLGANDEQVVILRQSGDLYKAGILADLNHHVALQIDSPKMQVYAKIALAEVWVQQGRTKEAIPLLEKAEQLAKKINDTFLLKCATGTLGNAFREVGQYQRAIDRHKRAISLARRTHSDYKVWSVNLAADHFMSGETARARSHLDRVIYEARALNNRQYLCQALGDCADILYQATCFQEAIEYYKEALAIAREIQDDESEAKFLPQLGQAYGDVGELALSIGCLKRAVTQAEKLDKSIQIIAWGSLGVAHHRFGELVQAIECCEKALALSREMEDFRKEARILVQLGNSHLRLNQYRRAASGFEAGRKIAQRITDRDTEASALLGLGNVQARQSQWAEAEKSYQAALNIAQELKNSELEAFMMGGLGWFYLQQDRLTQAEQTIHKAIEIFRQLSMKREEAHGLLNLSIVQIKRGDYRVAVESLKQSLIASEHTSDVWNTFFGYYNLGVLYNDHLNNLPQACIAMKQAVDLLEKHQVDLSEVEEYQKRFFEDKGDVYQLATECHLRLNQIETGLEIFEKGRTRLLAKGLKLLDSVLVGVPEDLRTRFLALSREVQALRSGTQEKSLDNTLPRQKWLEREQKQRQPLIEKEAELTKVIEQISQIYPRFKPKASATLTYGQMSELASEQSTAFVVLFVGRVVGKAIILHSSGTQAIDLPDLIHTNVQKLLRGLPKLLREELQGASQHSPQSELSEDWVSRLMETVRTAAKLLETVGWIWCYGALIEMREKKDESYWAIWGRLLDDVAIEIGLKIWQPLHPVLNKLGITRIVLVPDAGLQVLPLHLGNWQESNVIHDTSSLYTVSIAPSLTVYHDCLRQLARDELEKENLTLIVNPTKDLDFTRQEKQLLREFFKQRGGEVKLIEEDEATSKKVIETHQFGRYWHFAGHAYYDWFNPTQSSLVCHGEEHLTADKIQSNMDFRAVRLVALSACETGITDLRDPNQEYIGLSSAFLMVGSPAVLTSLWPVPDNSTALLMSRFYRYHLEDRLPPAEALNQAQQSVRQFDKYKHPYYWAAFTFVGV